MNGQQAGTLHGMDKQEKKKRCEHQRMVDDHYDQGKKTGRLVCRECGTVLQALVKASHSRG